MRIYGSRILVTGAAGFIGSHLVDRLVRMGAKVTAIDNLQSGSMENLCNSVGDIAFRRVDVRDSDALKRVGRNHDVVVHLAANATVPNSVDQPRLDFEVNAVGTFNVLELALESGMEQVVQASSAAVYGVPRYVPVDESHPLGPVSPYGASKLSAEMQGSAFEATYDLPFSALRIFNAYGPRQRKYVMYDLLRRVASGQGVIWMLGNRNHVRDFIYIDDVVSAFVATIERSSVKGLTCNVASGLKTAIVDLVDVVIKLLKIEDRGVEFSGESWVGDVPVLWADISKMRSVLDVDPDPGIEKGILALISDLGVTG